MLAIQYVNIPNYIYVYIPDEQSGYCEYTFHRILANDESNFQCVTEQINDLKRFDELISSTNEETTVYDILTPEWYTSLEL